MIYIISILAITLFSAVIPAPGANTWYCQYTALLLCLIFGAGLKLWKTNKWFSCLLIYCLFSTIWITKLSPRAILLLVQLCGIGFLIQHVSGINGSQRKKVVYGLIAISVIQAVYLIVQLCGKDFIFHSLVIPGRREVVGFMGNPNQTGSFYSILTCTLGSVHPAFFFVSLFGLIVTKSSVAFISAIISMLIYSIQFKLGKSIWLVIALCSGLSLFIFMTKIDNIRDSFSANVRIQSIVNSFKYSVKGHLPVSKDRDIKGYVKSKPAYGFGFGNYLRFIPHSPNIDRWNRNDEKFSHAHNDYVEALFELGYFGFALVCGLILSFIIGFIRSNKSPELWAYFCSIVAYLLNAGGNFVSHIAVHGLILAVLYGLYISTRNELNGKNTELV